MALYALADSFLPQSEKSMGRKGLIIIRYVIDRSFSCWCNSIVITMLSMKWFLPSANAAY